MNTNGVVVMCGNIAAPSFAAKLQGVRRDQTSLCSAYHMSSSQCAVQPDSDSTFRDKNLVAVTSTTKTNHI